MHRFLKFAAVDNARVALRSDASIWLIANEGEQVSVNRGSGWVQGVRLRLCSGDRIRIRESEIALADLCGHLGVNLHKAGDNAQPDKHFSGASAPVPLSAPASVIDNARRNPGTGQIEPGPDRTR